MQAVENADVASEGFLTAFEMTIEQRFFSAQEQIIMRGLANVIPPKVV